MKIRGDQQARFLEFSDSLIGRFRAEPIASLRIEQPRSCGDEPEHYDDPGKRDGCDRRARCGRYERAHQGNEAQ